MTCLRSEILDILSSGNHVLLVDHKVSTMSISEINYFVCTLGQAAQDNIKRPFSNVNDLISRQAKDNPDLPAIGFYNVSQSDHDASFTPRTLTYGEVQTGVVKTASHLSKIIDSSKGDPVGLLAASSPEFFFTWLACVWLGHPVLLIAPQCSPAAIAHLCKVCEVTVLLTDEKHNSLAEKAYQHATDSSQTKLVSRLIPFSSLDDVLNGTKDSEDVSQHATATDDDIAYLHHTSGTSSGLPKPIPQSHHGAVGVLPSLNGKNQATFTTTPLYHGGPADIFRAWTSNAMIWLFPSKDIPITAKNVTKCLDVAGQIDESKNIPPIKYFTSVPYILQMMAEDDEGLKQLQSMDLVGVGGAALATEIGDKLVGLNVSLVSRFGAAETGFLLSSHRDYKNDKAWQYLRHNEKVKQIKFEPQDEGLHELVVQSDWPHMAKRNREDGSYATSDLFARHPDLPNAWKYHSRADSQLTLVTGKKFDPAPLEDAIVAASTKISDVLLFGNGKPYPGVLLFKSKQVENMSSKDILAEVTPIIEKLNKESQSHARIPRNMLVVMPFKENPLEKSSKGTILRNTAEETYAEEIEASYDQITDGKSRDVSDEDLRKTILDLVKSIVADDDGLDADADLFGQGVDSVACVQIRHGLSLLLPKDAKKLPLTVVEDARTVTGLAELVKGIRNGGNEVAKTDQRSHIPELIQQFSDLGNVEAVSNGDHPIHEPTSKEGLNVLLTGPTGSLGAHVLNTLLNRPDIGHIYLLVRGASKQAARERVLKALSSRLLPIPSTFEQKVTILQCKLSEPDLGLNSSDYKTIQSQTDLILHLAWSVNFLLSLRSFTPHFAGIQNLLRLSLSSPKTNPPRLVFCSSVASVSSFHDLPNLTTQKGTKNGTEPKTKTKNDKNSTPTPTPERIVPNTHTSGPTGYALSKLTAELLLSRLATIHPRLHHHITIIRVGQLSSSTTTGTWNISEAYPQILASAKHTGGKLPDLGVEEKLGWLPVDVAARAFVEGGFATEEGMRVVPTEHVGHKIGVKEVTRGVLKGGKEGEEIEIDTAAVRVLHLLNPDGRYTFTDFLERLKELRVSVDGVAADQDEKSKISTIEIVPASQWLDILETLQSQSQNSTQRQTKSSDQQHSETQSKTDPLPLLRLLPFWKQAYSTRKPTSKSPPKTSDSDSASDSASSPPPPALHNSLLTMPSLTHWLGLNTLEGQRAKQRISKSESESEPQQDSNKQGDGVLNGDDRKDEESEGQGEEDKDVTNELLKAGYVRRTWLWVSENVK